MTFLELAEKRYSMRKFSDRPVEKEKIDKILEAARLAPTAVNYQPQRILVIEKQESLEKVKACTPYHFNAPLAFLICYDKNRAWTRDYDGQGSGDVDASIVTTHMMMAAYDMELGNTWVMSFDPAAMRKEFAIPDRLVPVALLPMGYPAEDARPSSWHFKRMSIGETVFYDDFSNWREED